MEAVDRDDEKTCPSCNAGEMICDGVASYRLCTQSGANTWQWSPLKYCSEGLTACVQTESVICCTALIPHACPEEGRMRCNAQGGFDTCIMEGVVRVWVSRDCGAGTVCRSFGNSVLCDYPIEPQPAPQPDTQPEPQTEFNPAFRYCDIEDSAASHNPLGFGAFLLLSAFLLLEA
eukprot:TRINITY_DN1405_c0_g1_i3.p1 TRINITY_DN1405_c0_g1~~TRINITY_DN1405_c0_g1_i3.p1  ORF type:complete len:175 (+),score=14.89 TRINITY_DN1405_c0_g1_i3:550-1074(+)